MLKLKRKGKVMCVVKVNVQFMNKLLELPSEEFYDLDNFYNDLENLSKQKDFRKWDFVHMYHSIMNENKIITRYNSEKICEDFIQKYYYILHLFDKRDFIFTDIDKSKDIYNILKKNYDQKDEVLLRLNKLIEIGITNFDYDENYNFNETHKLLTGEFLGRNNEECINGGVATDGTITFSTPIENNAYGEEVIYPYKIKDANYFISYTRMCKMHPYTGELYEQIGCNNEMVVKNLLFDINTLPTYEELNDFDVLPRLNYAEIEYKKDLFKQKEDLVSKIIEIDKLEEKIDNISLRLKHIRYNSVKCLDDIKIDLKHLKNEIINEAVNQKNLIEMDELEKKLVKRRQYEKRKNFTYYGGRYGKSLWRTQTN